MKRGNTLSLTLLIVAGLLIATASAQAMTANISHAGAAGMCSKHGGLTSDSSGATEGCSYKRGNRDYVVACVPPGAGKCTVVSVIKPNGGGSLGDKRPPTGTVKPISGESGPTSGTSTMHPLPGNAQTPIVQSSGSNIGYKGGGMNQSGGRR